MTTRNEDGVLSPNSEALGAMLRTIRNTRGLTLGDLKAKTGIPVSTLSKIETGRSSLSFDKLTLLAHGLNVDIASLMAGQNAVPVRLAKSHPGRRSVTLGSRSPLVETLPYDYRYPASDMLHKAFVPMIVEAKARTLEEFGELIRHGGEEFIIVLSGVIVMHSDLYAPIRLEVGDSVYFDSAMGHAYLAGSEDVCTLLSVCSARPEELEATRPESVTEELDER